MFRSKLYGLLCSQKGTSLFQGVACGQSSTLVFPKINFTCWHHAMLSFPRYGNSKKQLCQSLPDCCLPYRQESDAPSGELKSYYDRYVFPEPPELVSEEEHDMILKRVNECIEDEDRGRLFAVVQVGGKQYKITQHDLVQTVGKLSANLGDRIRLEKVLLVGGRDFTLVGRPLVRRGLVRVEATVVEHTPGAVKIVQAFKRKKNFEKRKKVTQHHTVLRINSIEVYAGLE